MTEHQARDAIRISDQGVERVDFLEDVLTGLRQAQKEIYSKYFYDERGSQLFDEITKLDEYYPTRTEVAIMEERLDEIVHSIGSGAMLVEYGSGSSTKTRLLLKRLDRLAAYVPIDISKEHLLNAARSIAGDFPGLVVLPVVADYTAAFSLPELDEPPTSIVVYFPGSTIGNFDPEQAALFLEHVADVAGPTGSLLVGVDLKKDINILLRAYNDASGVTAAFNLNLLARINTQLGADFCVDAFEHRAIWNAEFGRIEMHLFAKTAQHVTINGESFDFEAGESIHTENSHKFTVEEFGELAAPWFKQEKIWIDADGLFSVQFLTAQK